ncbi:MULTISPECIES: histidine phosphatase family protein [Larkinella]|uniref:Histidine phosphatase family protein n=1 Tax=Larkinella punicea TaxID=2315727 RepID=A0A368JJ00_9BACT|nr:histidine phosphatase family protein [Larkinella punicea]RCR66523.1 histidine phosphatase family protein [Larkinella punicea]
MEQKTIYLIRHGETDYNRQGIVQGSGVDSDLNAMGQAQAQAFHQAYQHIPFAKVYTSKLRRTMQSVRFFIDAGIPHESYEGLNEISWGAREGKTPNSFDNEYYRTLIENWAAGHTDYPTEDGESPEQVARRQKPVIDLILSRPDENPVLVCMHGRAIRILLSWLMNESLATMDLYEHSNLCLYKLIYDYDTSEFTIEVSNDSTHLLALVMHQ